MFLSVEDTDSTLRSQRSSNLLKLLWRITLFGVWTYIFDMYVCALAWCVCVCVCVLAFISMCGKKVVKMWQKSYYKKKSTLDGTRMKVENETPNNFSTFNHSHTFRPVCTRKDAARSLGFAWTTRAETRASSAHVRVLPRTRRTEATERQGLDTRRLKKY